ncbi:MAG: hypothetical protein ABIU76_12500 [Gemmatimonadaceae bacterium]
MRIAELTLHARAERLEHIEAELRQRLRPSCTEMPADQFQELVERMASLQLKYELRGTDGDG